MLIPIFFIYWSISGTSLAPAKIYDLVFRDSPLLKVFIFSFIKSICTELFLFFKFLDKKGSNSEIKCPGFLWILHYWYYPRKTDWELPMLPLKLEAFFVELRTENAVDSNDLLHAFFDVDFISKLFSIKSAQKKRLKGSFFKNINITAQFRKLNVFQLCKSEF